MGATKGASHLRGEQWSPRSTGDEIIQTLSTLKGACTVIVYARFEQMLTFLIGGRLVPVTSAEPRDPACLRDKLLKLVRELGVEVGMSLEAAIVTVDVVDVELDVLGPLDIGLEEPMIVFDIALAQRDALPNKSGEAATGPSTFRVCLSPDSVPTRTGGNPLPSG